jgi:hypothetical protein
MERFNIGETSEEGRHLLDSITDPEWHLHGEDLDTWDNVVLGPSLQ